MYSSYRTVGPTATDLTDLKDVLGFYFWLMITVKLHCQLLRLTMG